MGGARYLPKLAWGGGPSPQRMVEGRRLHTAVCDDGPSTMLRMVPLPPLRAGRSEMERLP
jgi:hypothetical protein